MGDTTEHRMRELSALLQGRVNILALDDKDAFLDILRTTFSPCTMSKLIRPQLADLPRACGRFQA